MHPWNCNIQWPLNSKSPRRRCAYKRSKTYFSARILLHGFCLLICFKINLKVNEVENPMYYAVSRMYLKCTDTFDKLAVFINQIK